VNRRQFLRAGAAAAGAAHAIGASTPSSAQVEAQGRSKRIVTSRYVPSGNIRDYLSREAGRITDRALADYTTATAFRRALPEKRRQFLEMMGPDDWWTEKREPPPVKVTGTVERNSYRIEKLSYESRPRLFVTANLYVPKNLSGRAPGVLYVCGHSQNQKAHYQAHPRRFAELGFVCLIVETVQLGEVEGFHHGCYREGWWHWYSRGYTPAGIELFNGIRALDLLAARPEVDSAKLGVTGISGGGATTWSVAAADERVKVASPVCGTATVFSQIHDRTVDGHCDCMWWINSYGWDLADVGALFAPRPLLIASANRDGIFTIESIRRVHAQLGSLYRTLGAGAHLRLVETPGGHSYHEKSRTAIFSWFTQHLMGRHVPPEKIGDIDDRKEKQESVETLRVFVDGSPAGNRTATIQDDAFTPPPPPKVTDAASVARERERVAKALKRLTFGTFPVKPPPLDLQVEHEFTESAAGHRFAFTSEEGWRLHGQMLFRQPIQTPAPVVVALRSPGEGRSDTSDFAMRVKAPWVRVAFEPRGTGDTSWGEDLNWHVRRAAAWTGRTIASMRVWDTLRALQAVRQLPEVDGKNVSLAARGEMCAAALYAALLDGNVRTVFLENPPATQNAASEKDGRGPAIEMLSCLRVTDLPHVAGLLWPAELVFVSDRPSTFEWAETLYRQLGAPGQTRRIANVADYSSTR
jgi:cephalosporin-C deacetylase-like acetyl esterase